MGLVVAGDQAAYAAAGVAGAGAGDAAIELSNAAQKAQADYHREAPAAGKLRVAAQLVEAKLLEACTAQLKHEDVLAAARAVSGQTQIRLHQHQANLQAAAVERATLYAKAAVEAEYKPGGSRNAVQVLANAGVPTALSFVYTELAARAAPVEATAAVAAAVIAYYACCCGDTWSSEIGVLSPQAPVLITTGKPVTPGTNGGVTLLGFAASACGGLFIGVIAALAAAVMGWGTTMDGVRVAGLSSRIIIVIAFLAGLLGSVADSLLGATVQYTGVDDATGKVYNKPNVELPGGRKLRQVAGHDWASNSMVNFMTATLSALLALVLVA
jgi:uncharacterized membrane protein